MLLRFSGSPWGRMGGGQGKCEHGRAFTHNAYSVARERELPALWQH